MRSKGGIDAEGESNLPDSMEDHNATEGVPNLRPKKETYVLKVGGKKSNQSSSFWRKTLIAMTKECPEKKRRAAKPKEKGRGRSGKGARGSEPTINAC